MYINVSIYCVVYHCIFLKLANAQPQPSFSLARYLDLFSNNLLFKKKQTPPKAKGSKDLVIYFQFQTSFQKPILETTKMVICLQYFIHHSQTFFSEHTLPEI